MTVVCLISKCEVLNEKCYCYCLLGSMQDGKEYDSFSIYAEDSVNDRMCMRTFLLGAKTICGWETTVATNF